MNSQTTSKPVEESEPPVNSAMGMIGLLQIIQNLITLGLNSIELWHTVIPKLRNHEQFSTQPELLNLHLLLTKVSQHLYSKLFDFFPSDLSQEKLPNLLAKQISSRDLLKAIKPLLNRKEFNNRSFSIESSNFLNGTVEDILATINCFETSSVIEDLEKDDQSISKPTSSKREHGTEMKGSTSSKRKRNRSPSPVGSSSASSEAELSHHSELDSDSDSDDSDKFDRLFKVKSNKKSPIKIKQVFQTQKKRLRRKLTTPGEEGRYMIKIELTDTKDLRKCQLNQFWTKVSAKAVFLTEPKSKVYKQIRDIMYDVGQEIKSTAGVQSEELKLDRKSR